MTKRQALMKKLAAAQFALFDLHLYLDTHPGDLHTLSLYKKFEARLLELRSEYENRFGSLSMLGAHGVEWLRDPWPWETEVCD
jgi:spore coat protein JB